MPKRKVITVNNIKCYLCTKCGKTKIFKDFYNNGVYKDGSIKKRSMCICCVKEIRKKPEYNEKIKEISKKQWINIKNDESKLKIARENNKIASKKYRENNKEKRTKTCVKYNRERRNNDISFRILCNCRRRLHKAVKSTTKSEKTKKLIGCNNKELMNHLESKFTDGMNWDNYGEWVIDHIIPCASFDLSRSEEQRRCFNYRNLQPMWGSDNSSKSNKYKFDIVHELILYNSIN